MSFNENNLNLKNRKKDRTNHTMATNFSKRVFWMNNLWIIESQKLCQFKLEMVKKHDTKLGLSLCILLNSKSSGGVIGRYFFWRDVPFKLGEIWSHVLCKLQLDSEWLWPIKQSYLLCLSRGPVPNSTFSLKSNADQKMFFLIVFYVHILEVALAINNKPQFR